MQPSGRFSPFTLLAFTVIAIALAGGYLFWGREPKALTRTSNAPPGRAPIEIAKVVPRKDFAKQSASPPVAQPPGQRAATAAEMEEHYEQATGAESRAEAARSLASLDNGAALQALARLFTKARAYTDRVAIVGALSDSHSEDNLDAKLAILRAALAQGQARQVRSVAVDVTAQLDDPRAVDLLRQAAKLDPDAQIREVARAALPQE
jgi:hypothetical protein